MSVTKPQILLLQLGEAYEKEIFDDLYSGLCTKIEEHYTVIKTSSLTTEHLAHSEAIVVTDGGLSRKKHRTTIQVRLSEYAKAGGTVILACLFSSFVSGPEFAGMCRSMNLPWDWGDYHRTVFALNPAFANVFDNEAFKTLEQSYSMKAVHLGNVHAADKVYVPTDHSRVQSAVFPPDRVDTAQTPAVWQKHGQGHIAYIGDVNNESGSQALIMAMLGIAAKGGPRQAVAEENADLPALVSGCEMCEGGLEISQGALPESSIINRALIVEYMCTMGM
ncbi:hypothetical protein HO133_007954 [Letharia lupina]|uniref:Uncharacterized protein n=1 Tax=Letharia lupina TaxID=560253 RepID=A0A8H6CR95_9LECA|nr:uncharacterized protein HO133_007954 [Letharia lupina]KAF6228224.1 hypothetical protein HO133_007954 [Letharia lupina]